jgi:hypothetical protein
VPEKISDEEWEAAAQAQPRTPTGIGARLAEMRRRVKAGPDHGVTRAQAAELLDGLTAAQLRAVAEGNGISLGAARNKDDLVRGIVNGAVGHVLDHHAVVGYPDQGIKPEWVKDGPSRPRPSDQAAAVSWTDPATGTVHVGTVTGRSGDKLDVEWSAGRVEHGVSVDDPNLTVYRAGTPEADRAQAEADRRNADRYRRQVASDAGDGWPPPPAANDTPDPFHGDADRKRDVESRLRSTIDAKLNDGRKIGAVGMVELRDALADVSKDEFDAAATNVFRHSDISVEPLRSDPDDPFAHFKPSTPEEDAAAIPFGGTQINAVRANPLGRNIITDEQAWRESDRDSAASYFATCDEPYLRTLAERLGVDPSGDADTLRDRLTDNAARNRREDLLRSHERTEDLKTLYEAEKAGTNPASWTEEERREVAAAAQRQKDNEWEPGAARAAKFADLPLDGSIPPERQAAWDKEMAGETAVMNGQGFVDHGDGEPCPGGQYHVGPCTPTNPDAPRCRLCGSDRDVTAVGDAAICGHCSAERSVYDRQPFPEGDTTGIPDYRKDSHHCSKCGTTMVPVAGTQNFDADGGANCTIKCPNCGMEGASYWTWSTGTAPAEDENLCDECGHWPGHSKHCRHHPKAEGAAVPEEPLPSNDELRSQYTARGGTQALLEMNYDQIMKFHRDMIGLIEDRISDSKTVAEHLTKVEAAVDGMEGADDKLRHHANVLMDAMDEAKLDRSSLEGVWTAAEMLDPDMVGEMADAYDIARDMAHEVLGWAADAQAALEKSERHIDATYGALAAGIQETGVSGKVLEGSATG